VSEPHDFDDNLGTEGDTDGDADFVYEVDDPDQAEWTFEMGPDSLGGSSRVRSRDEALDGELPLLMLHRGASYFSGLSGLIDEMHATSSASLSLGAVVNLPRVKPEVAQTWLAGPRGASVRIADPELYTRDDMWGPALLEERDGPPKPDEPTRPLMPQKTTPLWSYWNRSLPSGPTEAWVGEVLDAQRGAGADLLLTPGVPLNQHNPRPSLQQLEQQAAWARGALGGSERLAVNVTMDGAWLASPELRAQLLNTIVESNEDTWYVRVKWPMQPSYAQLADAAMLDGYREMSAVLDDEERVLLLPNTGGTGWVSLAWGATGFGTGMGNSARGFTTGRLIRRRAPAPTAPPRYYERALLHSVEQPTSDNLARIPGYTTCPCAYCFRLRNAPNWDHEMSGAHYLLAVAEETAALARGSGRRGVARRMVHAARRTRDRVTTTVPLTGRDNPAHLGLWGERLL